MTAPATFHGYTVFSVTNGPVTNNQAIVGAGPFAEIEAPIDGQIIRMDVTNTNVLKAGQIFGLVSRTNQNFALVVSGAGTNVLANTPPAVSMVAPLVGAQYQPRQPVALAARASDADGTIAKVEFFANGSKVADGIYDTISQMFTNTWTPPSDASATRLWRLKARAFDNDSAANESVETLIEIYYPLPGQAVASFLPPSVNGSVWAMAGDFAGRLYIAGDFTQVGGSAAERIARLDRTGSFDDEFLAVNGPDGTVRVLHYSARTNAIYLGGDFTNVAGVPRSALARLTAGRSDSADGSLDTNFLTPVIVRSNSASPASVRALLEQDDGRLVIGGNFTHVNGQPRANLARLNPDGTLDPTFAPHPNGLVHSLAALPDGKLYAAGAFVSLSGPTEMLSNRGFEGPYVPVALSNATGVIAGALPQGWTDNSRQASSRTVATYTNIVSGTVLGSALQVTTALLGTNTTGARFEVSQRFTAAAGKSYSAGVWVRADATRTVTLSVKQAVAPFAVRAQTNAVVSTDWQRISVSPTSALAEELAMAVSLEGAGRLTIDEASLTAAGPADYKRLVRLHPDGAIDRTFSVGSGTGAGFNGPVYSVAVGQDGSVYAGGAFNGYQGRSGYNNLAKLDPAGSLDPSFNYTPGLSHEVRNVHIRPEGQILVSGSFTNVGNVARQIPSTAVGRIVQFNQDGTLDADFNPGTAGSSGIFGTGADEAVNASSSLASGDVVAAGAFSVFNGEPRAGLTVVAGTDVLRPVITSRSFAAINAGGDLDFTFGVSAPGGAPVFTLVGTRPRGLNFDPATGRLTGVPLDSGTFDFSVVANSAHGSVTNPFQLNVGNVAVPYDTWKKVWFTPAEQSSSSISGPLAVPGNSRTGMANLLVYALDGGNPKTIGMEINPALARESIAGTNYLTLTAPKYRQAAVGDMTGQFSTNLSTPWQTSAVLVSNTASVFKIRAPEPATNSRLQFLRMSITSP